MKSAPIYVEMDMKVPLKELWEHTQTPDLHVQWDLRFSDILYLPRSCDTDKQLFLYRTRIGFGLNIEGTGETSSSLHHKSDERLSTLSFASDQPISLIKQGGGYWKYKQNGNTVTFSTLYDYKTRFGWGGRILDHFLFRPLFGYATAWSFDRLRIWLEDRIPPSIVAERAIIHYLSVVMLMFLWCYQGLVPKLLFPEAGELSLMQQIGWFTGFEEIMVMLLGIGEISFGLLTAYLHRSSWITYVQIPLLLFLLLPAILYNPEMLREPFNPLIITLPMIALCVTAHLTKQHLPMASRCMRKLKPNHNKGVSI